MKEHEIPKGATWVRFPKFVGDAVMHFPMLRLLRKMGIGPVVAYGPPSTVGLVRDNELVDCVVSIDSKPNIFRLAWMLRNRRAERCICFVKSHRMPAAAWLAGVPERIGMSDDGMHFLNSHHAPFWSGTGHFVQRYRAALARRWPDIPEAPFADYQPSARVESPKGDYICLMPGSDWTPKSWPVDRFRKLAALACGAAVDVVVLGLAHEARLGEAILGGLGDRGHNLCGATDLPQAAAWLHGAVAAIGNDSGLSHLAAACGTKTISIFGPTDPAASAPWGPDSIALRPQGLRCRPCLKKDCPLPEKECLTLTTPEEVWGHVI
jgi:ADP-heptose:LPS heptosyltransferase